MEFELSEYQKQIKDFFISHPHDNMAIEALAGSGKTSTALMLTELTKNSDVYVAFNKSIQTEMKSKLKNPKTKCYTMHGLALSVMRYNLDKEHKDITLDNFKVHKIVDEIYSDTYKNHNKYKSDYEYKDYLKDNYFTLYNIIRLKCIDVIDEDTIDWICDELGVFQSTGEFVAHTTNEMLDWIQKIDAKNIQLFEEYNIIDFTDMLYITLRNIQDKKWNIPFWLLFTNIYADEAQDLSMIQFKLLRYFKRSGGRYIFIFDPRQAIYGFSGADCKATSNIYKMFNPIEKFLLPINYRCGSSILSYVNRNCDVNIIPRPNANIGRVWKINDDDIFNTVEPDDFIIGRKNQQLLSMSMSLIRKGIKIYLSDKEIVTKLIKGIKATKRKTVEDIQEYCDGITDQYGQMDVKQRSKYDIENISLIVTMLKNFCKDHNKKSTSKDFMEYIQTMINTDNPNGCVRIMSIHKSKGLEANNVFVLNEGRPFVELGRSADMVQQEKNLSYVAMTRAKENLYLVRCNKEHDEEDDELWF